MIGRGGYLDQLDEHLTAMRDPRRLHLIVTGSRRAPLAWRGTLNRILEYVSLDREGFPTTVLFHGAAEGIDRWAASAARRLGWHVNPFPIASSDWLTYGNRAGPLRNMRMVDAGSRWYGPEALAPHVLCLALIHERSTGATGCALYALGQGVRTVRIDDETIRLPRMASPDVVGERFAW